MKWFFTPKKKKNDIREYLMYCKDNNLSKEKAITDTINIIGIPMVEIITSVAHDLFDVVTNYSSSRASTDYKTPVGRTNESDLDIDNYEDVDAIPEFIYKKKNLGRSYDEAIFEAQSFFGLSSLCIIEKIANQIFRADGMTAEEIMSNVASEREIKKENVIEYVSYCIENGMDYKSTLVETIRYFGTSNQQIIKRVIEAEFSKKH